MTPTKKVRDEATKAAERVRQRVSKLLDIFAIFYSLFLIGLLAFVIYYSLQYVIVTSRAVDSIRQQAFLLGIEIAIITTCFEWIVGRIKFLLRLYKGKLGDINLNIITRRKRNERGKR